MKGDGCERQCRYRFKSPMAERVRDMEVAFPWNRGNWAVFLT
jgi:hypothetical protein